MRTESTFVGKFSSQTTVCLCGGGAAVGTACTHTLVFMIWSLRGEKEGGSPAPATATRLELKSISQTPAAPSSCE